MFPRIKRLKFITIVVLFITLIFILIRYDSNDIEVDDVSNKLRKVTSGNDLSQLVVIIREFENFDNDVENTVTAILNTCQGICKVIVISDDYIYPPFKLHPKVKHLILKSTISHRTPDILKHIEYSTYVLLLPDGARISSVSQLNDFIKLLESMDSEILALGVGGAILTCRRYTVDIRGWTLTVIPSPDSESCDGISGKATLLLRTSHFVNFTSPMAKPIALNLGIQTAYKKWKAHIDRGAVIGESRHLYGSDQLMWKYETLKKQRVKDLFKDLGIKKVIGSSGRVEWHGCTKTSQMCFLPVVNDTPSYLFEGRWTPPCCLEGLRITARHVFKVLRSCHVRWWLEKGSLLGAVRYGDIIPWDYDVDIGIYANDVDKCPQLKSSRWQTLEDVDGFVWQKAAEGGFYRVQYSTANHLYIDIFPFYPSGGEMVRGYWKTGHKQDVDFPEHFLRPLSSVSFVGVVAASPNNIRDFLELKFGLGVIENPRYERIDLLNSYNLTFPVIH